jgi:CO dehydrogenase maturation factor
MKEGKIIAVSGKGGVGKTTVTALMVKLFAERDGRSLLVIDANPDSNLPEVLGVEISKTVGTVALDLKKAIERAEIPLGMDKKDILEHHIFEILEETPQFDFLVMGRTEGEGCYCLVNHLLTSIIDTLSKNYDVTIMDMEAGLEHLSRRTDRDVDVMVVVTDPSRMGLLTAKRIKELSEEVHIKFKKNYLIGNRFQPDMEAFLKGEAERIGVEYAGIIPPDPQVQEYNMTGKPLLQLSHQTPAVKAMEKIMREISLL